MKKTRKWLLGFCLTLLLVFSLADGNVLADEVDASGQESIELLDVEEEKATIEEVDQVVDEDAKDMTETTEATETIESIDAIEATEAIETPAEEDLESPSEMMEGWRYEEDYWYYYIGSEKVTGWLWVPTYNPETLEVTEYVWKYFDASGMSIDQFYQENGKIWLSESGPTRGYHKGWWTDPVNGQTYYFRETSGSRVEGWQFIDESWHYFRMNSGTLATGWQYIEGAWYYLDENGSPSEEGWSWFELKDNEGNVIDKVWKYFNDKGQNVDQLFHENGSIWLSQAGPSQSYYRGWWTDPANGQVYFFRMTSGSMVTNWQFIDGSWFYFRNSGTLAKGWQFIDDGWFYMRPATGSKAVGWQFIDGYWYYIDETTGRHDEGYETEIGPYGGENSYWFRPSGTLALGWQYIPTPSFVPGEAVSDMWHYFTIDKGDSRGWQRIDGSLYYFDPIYSFRYQGVQSTGDGLYSFNKYTGKLEVGAVKNFTNGKPARQIYLYAPTDAELSNAWLNDADWEQQARGQHLINYGLRYENVPFWWYGYDLDEHIGVYCSGAAYHILSGFNIYFPGPSASTLPVNFDPSYPYNGFNDYATGYAMVNEQLHYPEGEIYFGGDFDKLQAGDVFFGWNPGYTYHHTDNNWANHTAMYAGQNNGVHYILHSALKHGYALEPVTEITYNWGYGLRNIAKRLY